MLWFKKGSWLILVGLLTFKNVYAQSAFRSLDHHSEKSTELIKSIKDQNDEEIQHIRSPSKSSIAKIYSIRAQRLIDQIKKGVFVRNDTIQKFVDRVMQPILSANTIDNQPKRILILRDPNPNALCYGEGTFIVTIGLLSRIESESQLAFTLSHELAHLELNHVNDKIEQMVEHEAEKSKKGFFKTMDDEALLRELDSLREWMSSERRFNHTTELEADSLGFDYFSRTSYKQSQVPTLLILLNKIPGNTHLGPDLFLPFHSSKYPFNEYWLKPRLSVYHKRITGSIFSYDSTYTHPDVERRIASIKPRIKYDNHEVLGSEEFEQIKYLAQFESVESAFFGKKYDYAMYLALELFEKYPHDPYLVSMISKIFIELIEARSLDMFENYVSKYTSFYGDDLRLVNNFLFNLTERELGEVVYHFLNNKSNFDVQDEEHYYLLWKVCDYTHRAEMQKKIKSSYFEKFGRGNSYSKMN